MSTTLTGFLRPHAHQATTNAQAWKQVRGHLISRPLAVLMGYLLLFLVQFQILRTLLLVAHWELAAEGNFAEVASTYLLGLQFDLAVAAYVTLLLAFFSLLRTQKLVLPVAGLMSLVFWVLGLSEIEFYREYFTRYNSLAVHYWTQPGTVLKAIWFGFPVLRYLAMALVATAIQVGLMRKTKRWCEDHIHDRCGRLSTRALRGVVVVGALVILARGGLRGTPLKWGDAVHCDSVFLNHMALNGEWTLGRAILNGSKQDYAETMWSIPLATDEAERIAQEMLFLPGDSLDAESGNYPLLRCHGAESSATSLVDPAKPPMNVVVIIMESFTARFCGACGADASDDDHTPEFNRLAASGILFDRCFSASTHTHQANVAVSANFPTLPGHEPLMEDYELGTQHFEALPRACRRLGYETWFMYNGALEWENMRGFYALQGVEHFVGRDDFADRGRFDQTWGATDEQLFERVNQELRMAEQPFQATVLTLSNHAPYEVPRPYPFPEVADQGSMNHRINSMRYADWALGKFFDAARQEEYFKNTLFVLVGDHGYSIAPILTDLRLLRFHVPLLFYAPHLLEEKGNVRHTVVSQLDIAPTVLALLGDTSPHQHWGRDLFSLPANDPGFAVFKPSEHSAEMGYAHGDQLLVKSNDGQTHLYRYSLGFPAYVKPKRDEKLKEKMDRELQAYVTTALQVLRNCRAAVSD